jgi:hypothetical protein
VTVFCANEFGSRRRSHSHPFFGCPSLRAEYLEFPHWQDLYHAAVSENDPSTRLRRAQAAESAILKRLESVPDPSGNLDERRAILDAMGYPVILKLEGEKKLCIAYRKMA